MSNISSKSALNFEKTHADKKARWCELYKLKQYEKKDVFLARARATSFTASSCSTNTSSSSTMLPNVQYLVAKSVSDKQSLITSKIVK